ncbi:hypothetical protein NONO_c33480 [Nocardia nova SH22a]|uniref:FAS1-like dehydratase domain-containing protein n=1 Tax=Nocardia nova SH22a TaxID=1415166 RepID=W5TFK2_9NOCA|nr:MaoC family dehydratase N-terminal domain-containing protein [Nocardia nova]AHH18135.1 hypothetical protein NONO_c33480 [Nocardia nova SH22a]
MSWEPHTVVTDEFLDPGPVSALTALFGSGAPDVGAGDPLPPLWHWVALPRWPGSAEIGADGHPRRGSFLPPVDLPRRMFAGGAVRFDAPLTIGTVVRREARVVSVTPKQGRTGRLVVVVVEITLRAPDGAAAITERQDLVYRESAGHRAAAPVTPQPGEPVGTPLLRHGPGDWELRTDPTVLMRFSAATANAHRIHYDWPYATGVEGYPGLVVHGPLSTLASAETLRLDEPRPIRALRHRNLAPLFCGATARLRRDDESSPAATVSIQTDADGQPITHSALTADLAPLEQNSHA